MQCHKAQIIYNWFLEHNNKFTVLKWPPQSPDPNSVANVWQQQLYDAMYDAISKVPKSKCFWHLAESNQ